MHDKLKATTKGSSIDGVLLDMGANRTSIMCEEQYMAYITEFGLINVMPSAPNRTVRGIGERRKARGIAKIQIPFVDLRAVMDVDVSIFAKNFLSLLSLRDMYKNGMDLSIQGRYVSLETKKQLLHFENFFLFHHW